MHLLVEADRVCLEKWLSTQRLPSRVSKWHKLRLAKSRHIRQAVSLINDQRHEVRETYNHVIDVKPNQRNTTAVKYQPADWVQNILGRYSSQILRLLNTLPFTGNDQAGTASPSLASQKYLDGTAHMDSEWHLARVPMGCQGNDIGLYGIKLWERCESVFIRRILARFKAIADQVLGHEGFLYKAICNRGLFHGF